MLKHSISCRIVGKSLGGGYSYYDIDEEFDVKKCVGCDFYDICNCEPMVGTTYYYIKVIR